MIYSKLNVSALNRTRSNETNARQDFSNSTSLPLSKSNMAKLKVDVGQGQKTTSNQTTNSTPFVHKSLCYLIRLRIVYQHRPSSIQHPYGYWQIIYQRRCTHMQIISRPIELKRMKRSPVIRKLPFQAEICNSLGELAAFNVRQQINSHSMNRDNQFMMELVNWYRETCKNNNIGNKY